MIKFETPELEDLRYIVDPRLAQPTLEDLLLGKNTESQEDAQCLTVSDGSVRMEHCINLDLYLRPIPSTMESCYTDELDTPDTFVSEARNDDKKIINITTHQKQSDGNPFNFSVSAPPNAASTPLRDSKSNTMISSIFEPPKIEYMHASGEETMSGVDCGSLLSPDHFGFDINLNEYDFLLDYQDAIDADTLNDVNVTPRADSPADGASNPMIQNNAAPAAIDEHHNYALKLDINPIPHLEGEVLQTPDIINTILQCDPQFEGQIHCELIPVEEIKEEQFLFSPKSDQPDPSPQPPTPETYAQDDESSMQSMASSSTTAPSTSGKKQVRPRRKDDSDEDYVPPEVARKTAKRRGKAVERDSDDEAYTPPLRKRGRPAKPASARSSESSESSKYREMRDKNNEASRRSRQKRREQEKCVEEECEVLSDANVRLKAQVAELEKSVASYKSNLMSFLLKNSSR